MSAYVDIDIVHTATTPLAQEHETNRAIARYFRVNKAVDEVGAEGRVYTRNEREWEHYLRPEHETKEGE